MLSWNEFKSAEPSMAGQGRDLLYDVGVGLGLQTNGPGSEPGSWGGDYIYVPGYTAQGPVCVTWGRPQQMMWAWLGEYCDEVYGSPLELELGFAWS